MKRFALLFVLFALSAGAQAAATQVGRWLVGSGDPGVWYTATLSVGGSDLISMYCYPSQDTCVWRLALKTSCEKGHSHTLLASTNLSAEPMQLRCLGSSVGPGGVINRYQFENGDLINDRVRKANHVEFSLPRKAGGFDVVRFDLRRSVEAITMMMKQAVREMDAKHTRPADVWARTQ